MTSLEVSLEEEMILNMLKYFKKRSLIYDIACHFYSTLSDMKITTRIKPAIKT